MVVAWIVALFLGWQLQGGTVQTVQVTAPVQQTAQVDTFQGNQEDSDNLQPALGYNTLNQPYTGTLEVR